MKVKLLTKLRKKSKNAYKMHFSSSKSIPVFNVVEKSGQVLGSYTHCDEAVSVMKHYRREYILSEVKRMRTKRVLDHFSTLNVV
jgi:hypothetical protein